MVAVRSTFTPTSFEVNEGDIVTVAITNIEQTTDELHGFGLLDYNINLVIDPGETKVVTFTAEEGRVPVLLHELLLGAPPGDAGLPAREARQVTDGSWTSPVHRGASWPSMRRDDA